MLIVQDYKSCYLNQDDVSFLQKRVSESKDERYLLINHHSLEFVTGIQSIPLTRYNICPRMKRASRKSSVIRIFIGVIVSVVIFVLSSYINCLISVRNEIFQRRIDSVKANKKNLTSLGIISNGSTSLANNLVNANQLLMDDDDNNQTNENHIL